MELPLSSMGDPRNLNQELLQENKENTDDSVGASFHRLSELLGVNDEPLSIVEEASMLLQFAKMGLLGISGAKLSLFARTCFKRRYKFHLFFRTVAWILLIVEIFERPLWTYKDSNSEWHNGAIYPSYGMNYLPASVALPVSFCCVFILAYSVFLEFGFETRTSRRKLLYFLIMILGVKSLQILISIILVSRNLHPILSVTPLLAVVVLIVEISFTGKILYVVKTLPKFAILMALFGLVVCIFTGMSFLVFDPSSQEAIEYYPNFGVGLWNMLMMLNGSNWPCPIIPALNQNRLYFVFFFIYITLVNWGVVNLILGFVYVFFRIEQRYFTEKTRWIKEKNIEHAFLILDCNLEGKVPLSLVADVIQDFLQTYEHTKVIVSDGEKLDLAMDLDVSGDGYVEMNEFQHILDKCSMECLRILRSKTHLNRMFQGRVESKSVSDATSNPIAASFSRENSFNLRYNADDLIVSAAIDENKRFEFNPRPIFKVKSIMEFLVELSILMDTLYFDLVMDSIILILGFLFVSSCTTNGVLIALVVMMTLEFIAKMFVKGFYRYCRSYRNFIDGLVFVVIFILFLVFEIDGHKDPKNSRNGLSTVIIVRLLMFPRNILASKRFQDFRRKYRLAFKHAFTGAGQFTFLLAVLFAMMFAFSSVGQLLFGGVIRMTGAKYEAILNSYYGQSGYWPLNFNDMPSGMATTFVLLHVNNMHVTVSGFVAATSQWAEVFFAFWYAVGVLLLLNVITAFVVSEFISFLRTSQNKSEDMSRAVKPKMKYLNDEIEQRYSLNSNPSISEMVPSNKNISFDNSIFASQTARSHLREDYRSFVDASNSDNSFFYGNKSNGSILPTPESESTRIEVVANEESSKNNENAKSNNSFWINEILEGWNFLLLLLHRSPDNSILPHERAAVFVQCAREGHYHSDFKDKSSLMCYRTRNSMSKIFRFCVWGLSLLRIFERPPWTYNDSAIDNWSNESIYPMSNLFFIRIEVAVAVKIIFLCFIMLGLALEFGYQLESLTVRLLRLHYISVIRAILFVWAGVQIILLIIAGAIHSGKLAYLSTLGCIVYVFWFNRKTFHKLIVIYGVIPRMLILISLLALLVLLFAAFGPLMFSLESSNATDDANAEYFSTFGDSVWSIFVAITSSDYPNQVMPGYRRERENFIFFFSFICLGAFGILNIILVVVMIEFQRGIQNNLDIEKVNRHALLFRAFEALDAEKRLWLDHSQISALMEELYSHYNDFRQHGIPNQSKRDVMITVLDVDEDGRVSLNDFLFFMDVTKLRLKKEVVPTLVEQMFPELVKMESYKQFKDFSTGMSFNLFWDILILVLVLVGFMLCENVYQPCVATDALALLTFVVMMIEMIIKVFVVGLKAYFQKFRNMVDGIITLSLFFFYILAFSYHVEFNEKSKVDGIRVTIRVIEAFRMVVFVRNARYFFTKSDLKSFTRTITKILKSLNTLSSIFFCFTYIFISVGVLAYGGKISMSTTSAYYQELISSPYGENGFWVLNFNDFVSGFMTLYCCLHISDFDVITSGFAAVTSDFTRIYFTLWYLVGVLLLLNIVKSMFLTGFIQNIQGEKTKQKSKSPVKLKSEMKFRDTALAHKSRCIDNKLILDPNSRLSESRPSEAMMDQRQTFAMSPMIPMTPESQNNDNDHTLSRDMENESYLVSMADVKYLDPSDRALLQKRLKNLSNFKDNFEA